MRSLRLPRKSTLFYLIMAAVICWPLSQAQAGRVGTYITGFGGMTYVEDAGISGPGVPSGAEFTFDTGWNAGGAIGHDYGSFRAEVEVAYRENDLESASAPGFPTTPAQFGEQMQSLSYMLNLFLDFENNSPLTPYLGGGIGGATIEISDNTGFEDDDTVFAFKGAAGISWSLGPNLDLLVDYTYLRTTDPEFSSIQQEIEYSTHNVSGGIRFRF